MPQIPATQAKEFKSSLVNNARLRLYLKNKKKQKKTSSYINYINFAFHFSQFSSAPLCWNAEILTVRGKCNTALGTCGEGEGNYLV